ncbi:MAG: DASS family sodium-coupled anion symporter, partial [Pseudomonadota bacterium]
MLARAIEAAGLHRRIALGIVSRIGAGPRNLTLGFVIATAFLSMWITNTAATIMMFAVALSVIEVVRSRSSAQDAKHVRRFSVGLMLAVAYSASIGGMATLIGSPVNGLLATTLFAEYGIEIEFVDWLLMGLPVMLIMLVAAWALLTLVLFRSEIGGVEDVDAVIRRERDGLGPMSGPERVVTGVFVLAAVGWILGDPLSRAVGLPISDTTVAIAAAVLLFAIPTDRTFKNFPLDWERARTLPWNVLLLIGGGLAIATGFQSTGLAAVIGGAVSGLDVSVVVLVALMTVMMVFLTEVMSNPASAATILPVAAALAVGVGVSPLLLAVPAALAANMSFMMPVATAPNAIVFSHKELTTKDMAKAGFFLNIIGAVVCVAVTTLTYRPLYGW